MRAEKFCHQRDGPNQLQPSVGADLCGSGAAVSRILKNNHLYSLWKFFFALSRLSDYFY
jgi:hypothetical protein